jgi:hypothetical protein
MSVSGPFGGHMEMSFRVALKEQLPGNEPGDVNQGGKIPPNPPLQRGEQEGPLSYPPFVKGGRGDLVDAGKAR